MNLLDLTILLLVLASVFRGWQVGLFRQALTLAGFWAGLAGGAILAVRMGTNLSQQMRVPAVLGALALCIFVGLVLGELLGRALAALAKRLHIGLLDSVMGGLLGAVTTLFAVWLLAAIIALLPLASLSRLVRQSAIARGLSSVFPSTPELIAKVEQTLVPSVYPQVFAGLAPLPAPPVEPVSDSDLQKAILLDQRGVVKIQGLACGSIDEGSGFLVAPNVVATNAHVVAGVKDPLVYDDQGSHDATVVFFDPDTDLALLRVAGLDAQVLTLDTKGAARGTKAAALGYPEGGPFTGVSASVLQEVIAEGQNIYDTGSTTRHVYELQSDIQPGNSGGPLVLTDGKVVGVVFARSQSDEGVGYALTEAQVGPEIQEHITDTGRVSTGQCIVE